jgi:hypothetical protein
MKRFDVEGVSLFTVIFHREVPKIAISGKGGGQNKVVRSIEFISADSGKKTYSILYSMEWHRL